MALFLLLMIVIFFFVAGELLILLADVILWIAGILIMIMGFGNKNIAAGFIGIGISIFALILTPLAIQIASHFIPAF